MSQCAKKNGPFFPAPAEVHCPNLAAISCLAWEGRGCAPLALAAGGVVGSQVIGTQDEVEAANSSAHRAGQRPALGPVLCAFFNLTKVIGTEK